MLEIFSKYFYDFSPVFLDYFNGSLENIC